MLRLRLETEISEDGETSRNELLAQALAAAAASIRAETRFLTTDEIDVPEGRLAYMVSTERLM